MNNLYLNLYYRYVYVLVNRLTFNIDILNFVMLSKSNKCINLIPN